MTTALTERHTIHEMTVAYREEVEKIMNAHRTLEECKQRLVAVFNATDYAFDVNPERLLRYPRKEREALLKTATTRTDKNDKNHVPAMNGETTYFRWKCYRNGNLHLEFKRLDLLQTLNEVGGAGMLR